MVKNQARLGHTVASSKIMVNLLFGMVCISSQICGAVSSLCQSRVAYKAYKITMILIPNNHDGKLFLSNCGGVLNR